MYLTAAVIRTTVAFRLLRTQPAKQALISDTEGETEMERKERNNEANKSEYTEKLVHLGKVTKVVKGGKNMRWNAHFMKIVSLAPEVL